MISAKALLDPTILFFLLGVGAGLIRSNLAIPSQMARFLALYLLMALGLKGGFALAQSGFQSEVLIDLALAIFLALAIPMAGYAILRRFTAPLSAAAVAAAYGSVSAVTFITTVQYLDNQGVAVGGHMSAALALMESPAILFAVLMANLIRAKSPKKSGRAPVADASLRHVLQESFTEGTQILLLGSMVVGYLTGEQGKSVMEPFTGDIFKGMLAFFLLDMGMATAAHFQDLQRIPKSVVVYGVAGPLVHAIFALWLCSVFGVSMGNAVLLMVLAASASYIAVPAVIKHAIPEASPLLYLGMPLGLTFPYLLDH